MLATEGSVEFAAWPRTLPRKDKVENEVMKEVWPKNEKKEFNAVRNKIFRSKTTEVSTVPETDGNEKDNDQHCRNVSETKCIRSITEGSAGTIHSNNHGICNDLLITPQVPGEAVKRPSNSVRNNDTSGGITAENVSEVDSTWGAMVSALDPSRDVILFPSEQAVCASVFKWGRSDGGRIGAAAAAADSPNEDQEDDRKNSYRDDVGAEARKSSDLGGSSTHRWRLIVLEASWQHGKTMYRQVRLKNFDLVRRYAVAEHPSFLFQVLRTHALILLRITTFSLLDT